MQIFLGVVDILKLEITIFDHENNRFDTISRSMSIYVLRLWYLQPRFAKRSMAGILQ